MVRLNAPTLVIFGADDQRWRPSSSADYRVVPDVRAELLSDVGHTPVLEDPQQTARLLLSFASPGHPRGSRTTPK
ncbi:hypothetical protein GCM10010404_85170 [Nonomuraea africana]|uniref:alpha/beta fold hydrolase n=1 Tax=Nonomuraea africana TaxID=46171 RepID=UPI00178AECA2|nr:hypothetical protein [Nonomuraea africana]